MQANNRKFFRFFNLLVLLSVLFCIPLVVSAETSGTCGRDAQWSLHSDGTLTISGTGLMKEYSRENRAPWYDYSNQISSVVIEDGITSIGELSFYNCFKLTSVTIPGSVTEIGMEAFANCAQLESVKIPDGVIRIGDSAFSGCKGLTTVKIANTVQKISSGAFYKCTGLNEIILPSQLTAIDSNAFRGCSSLKSITIPSAVTQIGSYAFYESGLTSIAIPNCVERIHSEAFGFCNDLQNIYISGDLPEISPDAFKSVIADAYYHTGNETYSDAERYGGDIIWKVEDEAASKYITHTGIKSSTRATMENHGLKTHYECSCSSKLYEDRACTKEITKSQCGIALVKSVTLSTYSYAYDGREKTPQVIVKDKKGKILTEDVDYRVYYAAKRVNLGNPSVRVVGTGNYSFDVTLYYAIVKNTNVSAKLSAAAYHYDGDVKTPSVSVKDNMGNKLVNNRDFTVSYSGGRKTVGTYDVSIKGKGNYSFNKTLSFRIDPPKTAIYRQASGTNTIKVFWTMKAQTTGYQIQYSTKKDFSSGVKTVTVKDVSTTEQLIKNLVSGKTYYVRIRTYKTVGGTNYTSAWSSAKAIKTK